MCLWKTLTSFDMASFFSKTVLSSLPSSSAKEGLGEEALPFVLFSDRHKGLRLTALATRFCSLKTRAVICEYGESCSLLLIQFPEGVRERENSGLKVHI